MHEISNLVFWENKEKKSKYRFLKILPRVLSDKEYMCHIVAKCIVVQESSWNVIGDRVESMLTAYSPSRKHAYIVLTPLNPTFI